MIDAWTRRVVAWWTAASRADPQQQQPLRDLILSVLCLHLCEQRGLIAADRWRLNPTHRHLAQLLRSVCDQYPLPIPSGWIAPPFQADSTLQKLWGLEVHPLTPVEVLGQVYEKLLDRSLPARPDCQIRKSGGVYYTPRSIAQYIVEQTVGTLLDTQNSVRVLDPACGGGIFLLTAYQYLLDRHPTAPADRAQILLDCIFGVDLDPEAIVVTQLALLLKLLESPSTAVPDLARNIQCGNTVIGTAPPVMQGSFDVVIGNPPYLDSEQMAAHLPDWRRYCVQHYRTAAGNWDLFCVFIEKSLELCQTGGYTSLIVPNKLASADYAAAARSLLCCENQLRSIRDYSQVKVFAAAVYPLVYVAQKQLPIASTVHYELVAPERDSMDEARSETIAATADFASEHFSRQPWMLSVHFQQIALCKRLHQLPPLASIAQIWGAATVAEAYALKPLICEMPICDDGDLKLVNSGTIDRYRTLWGEKRLRYLGATYLHPAIPQNLTQHLPQKRHQQATQPKLLIAGMTKQLECAIDLKGEILAGKSTSIITAMSSDINLCYLLGLLNSRLVNLDFTHCFGGNRLQGGYFRIAPPQLKQIPIPLLDNRDDRHRHDRMVALVEQLLRLQDRQNPSPWLEQSDLEQQIDRLVYELYHLTDVEIEAVTRVLM